MSLEKTQQKNQTLENEKSTIIKENEEKYF